MIYRFVWYGDRQELWEGFRYREEWGQVVTLPGSGNVMKDQFRQFCSVAPYGIKEFNPVRTADQQIQEELKLFAEACKRSFLGEKPFDAIAARLSLNCIEDNARRPGALHGRHTYELRRLSEEFDHKNRAVDVKKKMEELFGE